MNDRFDQKLDAVLAGSIDGYEALLDVRRLSGGASQETYRISVRTGAGERKFAMRRAAGGVQADLAKDGPSLETEARLMQVAASAGVPEPEILHVLSDEDQLGDGFVMEWLDGETLGARINKLPELDAIRPKLAYQTGQILARIHGIDVHAAGLAGELSIVSTEEFIRAMWDTYKSFEAPFPMIDYTACWLLDHLPPEQPPKLVHNDFRNGNLMVTADGINAVLDWELAHIGDPVRDIGWICTNSWRFGNSELPVGGFGRLEDLLDGYEQVAGVRPDDDHIKFWEIFGSFWWAVGSLKMANMWRNGPDRTVERPAIARRTSECQMDCANLIIPGPVEVVGEGRVESSVSMPDTAELLTSVSEFLRGDLQDSLKGRDKFLSLVASNSIDIVRREMSRAGPHRKAEQNRLADLIGTGGELEELRWKLVHALRDGNMKLDHPGLAVHLRNTVANQLAIDQPKYSGLAIAQANKTK